MKKLFAMILAAMMILCSCAFAETTDNSLQAILDKGTLVLGLDASFEPMGYTNMDGEIVGYDIDLAKEVCARLGVELVVQPIEWAAKELELSSGNIDCIWNGMSITPERQESMALSEAYMNNQIVLLVCDDSLKSKDDLAGKKMGVQSGSFAEEVLETYEQYADYYASLDEVLDYQDYETAIMDMKNGQNRRHHDRLGGGQREDQEPGRRQPEDHRHLRGRPVRDRLPQGRPRPARQGERNPERNGGRRHAGQDQRDLVRLGHLPGG